MQTVGMCPVVEVPLGPERDGQARQAWCLGMLRGAPCWATCDHGTWEGEQAARSGAPQPIPHREVNA
jgi:hypothetical protein